ncbi:tRNA guanosine(34) transglycosylase Tgt [Candidatus Falkowbacteria bacterium]|nr:tRNA guanosine(34) transglycosylase Tgt [Candidatus Falkowbacteria bacterium]
MFKLITRKKDGRRLGLLKTRHGLLKTPFFMPDATRAFIKLSSADEVLETKTKAMVVNTFHLYLQPGLETIKKAGGVHKFMAWDGPLLSDSGGFQVFSLIHKNSAMGKIDDDKVVFKSPLNGSRHEFSPEKAIQIQFDLGVDMMVCLDDCPPNEFSRHDLEKAVERTINWAKRCKLEYEHQIKKRKLVGLKKPLIFGVIQGGAELDLREKCTKELVKIGFDGYGFGARHVDKNGKFLKEILKKTASFIPENSLRFALGVGSPEDIKICAELGWDMFDCVIPTREGRHGKLFLDGAQSLIKVKTRSINISNAIFNQDFTAINKRSNIKALKTHSRSYLKHLFQLKEPLGQKLAALNNLEFYQKLMTELRAEKKNNKLR